jgi:hypothetical protein
MHLPATFTKLTRWGVWLLLILSGCVEPYVPAVVDAPTNYLVIDGFINGSGVTRIKLSRTSNIAITATPPVEKGARLFIVDNTGARYPLTEKGSGSYQSDSLLLNVAHEYQLRITTATNATYESTLVPLKATPPIDNLSWNVANAQVQIQLSTHDPTGQSRYYRWNVDETWQFNSLYNSELEYDPVQKIIVARTTPIYTCWRTERPTTIKQGSSAQLSQDALTNFNLLDISTRAERLKVRYSVLVSQYAETAEEFAYYELLRKNTEAVGTVNDPLPSQLTGNVHRVDKVNEPVLGYIGAHTIQQKRLFISRQDLPAIGDKDFENPYSSCITGREIFKELKGLDSTYYLKYPNTIIYQNPNSVPISLIIYADKFSAPVPIIQGYLGSSRECVDCRTRGSNVKPNYW